MRNYFGIIQIFSNEKGNSILFVALMMPAILLIAAVVIDLGYIYVQRAQLQNAGDFAAQAAVASIADEFVEQAQAERDSGSSISSDNPFDYFSESEITSITESYDVLSMAEAYVLNNANDQWDESTACEYYTEEGTGDCQVEVEHDASNQRIVVRVQLRSQVEPLLPHFFDDALQLTVQALATISTT